MSDYIKEVFFFAKWLLLLIVVFILTCFGAKYDPDTDLLAAFFDFRGTRDDTQKISLVLFSNEDLNPPLKLSPKYLPTLQEYGVLISRIKQAGSKMVLVNKEGLARDESANFDNFFKTNGIEGYTERLYSLAGNWTWGSKLEKVPVLDSGVSPILRHDGFVYKFPEKSELFDKILGVAKDEQGKIPAYINFYGKAATLPILRFTDVLMGKNEELEQKLKDKIVLIAMAAPAFLKGQIDSSRYKIPLTSPEMSAAEIQATLISNLFDKSFISDINRKHVLWAFVSVFAISIMLAAMAKSKRVGFPVTGICLVVFCLGVLYGAYYIFSVKFLWGHGVSIIVAIPLLTLFLFCTVSAHRFLREYFDKRDMSLVDC